MNFLGKATGLVFCAGILDSYARLPHVPDLGLLRLSERCELYHHLRLSHVLFFFFLQGAFDGCWVYVLFPFLFLGGEGLIMLLLYALLVDGGCCTACNFLM